MNNFMWNSCDLCICIVVVYKNTKQQNKLLWSNMICLLSDALRVCAAHIHKCMHEVIRFRCLGETHMYLNMISCVRNEHISNALLGVSKVLNELHICNKHLAKFDHVFLFISYWASIFMHQLLLNFLNLFAGLF